MKTVHFSNQVTERDKSPRAVHGPLPKQEYKDRESLPLALCSGNPKMVVNGTDAESWQSMRTVAVGFATVALPALFTLRVAVPEPASSGPFHSSHWGYTWSLLLFIVPLLVLGAWFAAQPRLGLARRAFWRSIAVLTPLGFGLDLLLGNAFFNFPNRAATLGWNVPAIGGPIPIEEFVFYLTGFMVLLLTYIWADEHWLAAYHRPPVQRSRPATVGFHRPPLYIGLVLACVALLYKSCFSPDPSGFPGYFLYLILASVVPSILLLRQVQGLINWRAFSLTFSLTLGLSLFWEVTLALPYGWWGYQSAAMMGLTIPAWHDLPVEAVFVWVAVSFTTVIVYEALKLRLLENKQRNTSAVLNVPGYSENMASSPSGPLRACGPSHVSSEASSAQSSAEGVEIAFSM